jgi:NAD(P)-dependent dehydrogenase (short-subunit alcohol dehydrogenase family)
MYGIVSPITDVYDTPQSTNPPSYGAAKAALGQLTRYAACEFGHEGIRVNAVAPGPFPAPVVQQQSPEFVARLCQQVPMKRIGSAEEIAGPVAFLLSRAASFVNGAVLTVDGGWTSW